ncbi:hypothetical protein PIB30_055219 [Stylosanthes scabra]|uniref:AAA-type ATPase N-terminal domain-containing protein n=1 Tax=Stylosanthes scabra TaxID=79078 RepID=A0ABU6TKN0_9FABA|nr:hypothetical protein [Stylosanthes scabra]
MSDNTNSTVIVSAAATAMLIPSVTNELLPSEVLDYFSSKLYSLRQHLSSQFTIAIEEFHGMRWNQAYDAADVTLSGLLNHKEKLDPALLRPERMDMHIHLSYCTFNSWHLTTLESQIIVLFMRLKSSWKKCRSLQLKLQESCKRKIVLKIA